METSGDDESLLILYEVIVKEVIGIKDRNKNKRKKCS